MARNALRLALIPACGLLIAAAALSAPDAPPRRVSIAPLGAALQASSTPPPAIAALITSQLDAPDTFAQRLGPPLGLHADLRIAPTTDARARMPLAQALNECRRPAVDHHTQTTRTNESIAQADRLGARARTLRLEGQLARALDTIRDAARLDETNPAHWHELGAICIAMGNRPAALVAWRRAFELGARDFEMLLRLGWLAHAFGEHDVAASSLAQANDSTTLQTDPAMRLVLSATLGRSLLALGYVSAARDLLVPALDLPAQVNAEAPWDDAIEELARERALIWTDLGDALLRAGAVQDASHAYTQASRAPGVDPGQLLRRRVYLDMAQGASASAAWRVLDSLHTTDASTAVELVRYICQCPAVGPALRQAIEQTALAGGGNRITLTRARAAATADVNQRAAVLGEHLAQYGPDWAIIDDLRTVFSELPSDAALHVAADLLRTVPHLEPWISDALPPIDLDATKTTSDDATRILVARSIEGASVTPAADPLRGPTGALRLLEEPCEAPFEAARVRAMVRASVAAALGPRLDDLLDRCSPTTTSDRLVLAEALAERGRARDTLHALKPLLENLPRQAPFAVRTLSLAAEQHARLEQWSQALDRAAQAIAIDPMHEPAHAVRLQILGGRNEAADSVAFGQALSDLRAASSESTLLLWMRANQARLSGQAGIAEDALLRLTDRTGVGRLARGALVDLWLDAQEYETAAQHIRAWIDCYPTDPQGTVQLARTLAGDHRGEAARLMLTQALRVRPGELDVLAVFEELIHNKLVDPRRTGENERGFEERRLANAPPTMDTFLERARVATHGGDLQAAQSWIHKALQQVGDEPAPALVRALNNQLPEMVSVALQRSDSSGQDAAIEAYDDALRQLPQLSRTIYDLRLSLFQTRVVDPHRYVQAILACARVYPDHTNEYIQRAAASLVDARPWKDLQSPTRERVRAGTAMLRETAGVLDEPSATLLGIWLYYAATTGEHIEVRDAVTAAIQTGMLRDGLASWAGMTTRFTRPDSEDRFVKLASQLASCMLDSERALSVRLYEEALRMRPLDPEASNSFGYRLLDDDDDIERATLLITNAHKRLPNEPHVTDSMGWLAFKTGRIHDDIDPETGRLRSGAVTLLELSLHQLEQRIEQEKALRPDEIDLIDQEFAYTRSEVSNHLGDALWLAGERESAIHDWTEAMRLAATALKGMRDGTVENIAPDRAAADLEQMLQVLPEKLSAARTDRQPALAKVHGPINRPMTPEERRRAAISQFPRE
ncbi:MAG: hypothetical protein KDA20_10030 [Phycisphaerales bacterium]|nr:hypothetical protein [Phycisphaerales bacterium]